MKAFISITIAAIPILAYLGFTMPSEGMSNIAHTLTWFFSSIAFSSFVGLLVQDSTGGKDEIALHRAVGLLVQDSKDDITKKPTNKFASFFVRLSYFIAAMIYVFFGSIETGVAALFCGMVSLLIAAVINSTGK